MITCANIVYTESGNECNARPGCIKQDGKKTGNCICDTHNNFELVKDGSYAGSCICKYNYGLLGGRKCVLCNNTSTQQISGDGNCVCKNLIDVQDHETGVCRPSTECTNTAYQANIIDCTIYGDGCVNPSGAQASKCVCSPDYTPQTDGSCAKNKGSPLAIVLICASLLLAVACVAAAAVVKHKAAARRTNRIGAPGVV